MILQNIRDQEYFRAGDESILCELLHPKNFENFSGMRYSLAHARVEAGQSTLPHRLRKSSEVYYILSGTGTMHIGTEKASVTEGQAIYIPPGSIQFIENTGTGDLVFLAIVDPLWREEDEEIFRKKDEKD